MDPYEHLEYRFVAWEDWDFNNPTTIASGNDLDNLIADAEGIAKSYIEDLVSGEIVWRNDDIYTQIDICPKELELDSS